MHVVRVHDDAQVVHPEGRVDPLSDVDAVDTELLFADLEQAERRLERVARQARSLDKQLMAEERWLREVVEALQAGRAVRTVPPPEDAPGADVRLQALTSKPVLYVANVAEGEPLEPPPSWWPTRASAAPAPRRCPLASRPSWRTRRGRGGGDAGRPRRGRVRARRR